MKTLKQERLGKWTAEVDAVRAIRQLQDMLDEAGLLTAAAKAESDNALYTLLAKCPQKVRDEVRHG